jgi:hypothetical protein
MQFVLNPCIIADLCHQVDGAIVRPEILTQADMMHGYKFQLGDIVLKCTKE